MVAIVQHFDACAESKDELATYLVPISYIAAYAQICVN